MISHIKRFRENKTITRMKSNNTLKCSLCPNEAHHIHHIDHNNKNQKPENLQPLCTLCHAKIHGIEPRLSEIKRLVILLNRTQKARIAIDNQIHAFGRIELAVPDKFQDLIEQLNAQEKDYEKQIKKMVDSGNYPTAEWLLNIKGIKHVLAAKILAYVDFTKTHGVGKLWAYAGLKPDSKKAKGKKANWNGELRMICCGQIADSFIKQRTPKYREIYDTEKARQLKLMEGSDHASIDTPAKYASLPLHADVEGKDQAAPEIQNGFASPPKSKMHAHKRAIRKMVKEFLKDYYIFGKGTNSLIGLTITLKPSQNNQIQADSEDKLKPYILSNPLVC